MNKITNTITIFLCALSAFSLWFLSTTTALQLDDSQLVSSFISITASLGALISATFVVFSYL